jgi:SAM-dependent methyltransferase
MSSRDHPYPPFELAERVCSLEGRGEPFAAYEKLGAETKGALLRLVGADWSFEGKRVLDFGCGAGRTLRHFLQEAQEGELWGADLDGASVEWLQGALCPPLHAVRSTADPPLELEGASFDLIWALSVFTHLTDNSIPWLLELHRLLKPDGLLIATYMGQWNSEALAREPWDEDRVGMNVLRHDQGWDWGGPWVLMSDWWVRAHWGRAFEILDTEPQVHGQTWVLMRKRAVDLTPDDLEAPADDPREYQALRHNIHQLQREIEQIKDNRSILRANPGLRGIRRLIRGLRARAARIRD